MCISTYNTYVYIRAQVKRLHLLEYERRGRQYPHELVVSVAMPTATGMCDANMTFRDTYIDIYTYTYIVVSVAMPTATGMRDADMTFRDTYIDIYIHIRISWSA